MKRFTAVAAAFLLVGNSYASIVVVNGLSHEHKLANGVTVQGSIVIRNTGDIEKRAKVYKTDVQHNCKGETAFLEATDRDRCSSKWMAISDNEILMQPGQTLTITYGLTPPSEIESTGSYWGVIMVEEMDDLDTTLPEVGVKVNALVRYAIQIIGNFPAGAVKQLDFVSIDLDTLEGRNQIRIAVLNPGNFMMKPIMVLDLIDAQGNQVARKELPYQKVYPGFCKLFDLPLQGIPSGEYSGILVADCGDEDMFGMKIDITINNHEKQ